MKFRTLALAAALACGFSLPATARHKAAVHKVKRPKVKHPKARKARQTRQKIRHA